MGLTEQIKKIFTNADFLCTHVYFQMLIQKMIKDPNAIADLQFYDSIKGKVRSERVPLNHGVLNIPVILHLCFTQCL